MTKHDRHDRELEFPRLTRAIAGSSRTGRGGKLYRCFTKGRPVFRSRVVTSPTAGRDAADGGPGQTPRPREGASGWPPAGHYGRSDELTIAVASRLEPTERVTLGRTVILPWN